MRLCHTYIPKLCPTEQVQSVLYFLSMFSIIMCDQLLLLSYRLPRGLRIRDHDAAMCMHVLVCELVRGTYACLKKTVYTFCLLVPQGLAASQTP